MTDAEGLAFLCRNGWLSRVAPELQAALVRLILWRRFGTAETVGLAGDDAGGIFGLAAGQLGQTSGIGRPDSPIAHLCLPGSWEGTAPLFGHPRQADTVAMTNSLVAFVPLARLRALLAQNPGWWEDIGRLLMLHTIRFGGGMTDLLIRDSAIRCAAVLLRLAGCRYAGDAPVAIHFTQTDLAASANLSRHTAGEALRELEQQNIIRLGYGVITILDPIWLRGRIDAG